MTTQPTSIDEGQMDVNRFHLGRAFKSIMKQENPEEAFVQYITTLVEQAKQEGRDMAVNSIYEYIVLMGGTGKLLDGLSEALDQARTISSDSK